MVWVIIDPNIDENHDYMIGFQDIYGKIHPFKSYATYEDLDSEYGCFDKKLKEKGLKPITAQFVTDEITGDDTKKCVVLMSILNKYSDHKKEITKQFAKELEETLRGEHNPFIDRKKEDGDPS